MSFIRELRAQFTAGADGFRRTIQGIRDDMRSVGDVGQQSTAKAESGFSKLKSNIMGFGAAYLGFEAVKGGVTSLAGAMVGGNADMETYRNTLTQVLHSSEEAGKTLEWATQFAAQTPFEIPNIVEATTKLEIYGFKSKDVLGSIGDMASVMGKPLMQAVEAVADAQTGELERLKEFGITKQMLIDKARAMGKGEIVNAQGTVTNMKGLNDALFQIMNDRYKGGMEIQSKTFKGMMSNLQDSLGTMTRELGKPLFEKFKAGLQTALPIVGAITQAITGDTVGAVNTLNDVLGKSATDKIMGFVNAAMTGFNQVKDLAIALLPTIQNLFSTLWNIIKPVAEVVGVALVAAFQILAPIIPPILNTITGIAKEFTGWEGFGPLIIGLAAAFGTYKAVLWAATIQTQALSVWTKLQTAYQYALNLAMSLNPIGLVIAAIVGLGVAFVLAYQHSETFRNIINGLWSALKDGFAAAINWFAVTLPAWIASVGAWFTNLWTSITTSVSGFVAGFMAVWNGLVTSVTGIVSGFVAGVAAVIGSIASVVMPYIDMFVGFFVASWENLKLLVMGIVGVFLNLLIGDFDGVRVSLLAIWDAISSQVMNIINTFINLAKMAFTDVKNAITFIVTGIRDFFVNAWTGIKTSAISIITGLKDGIVNGFNNMRAAIPGIIQGAKDAIVNGFTNAKNSAISLITGMKDGIWNKIVEIKNNFLGMKDNIISTIRGIDLMQIGKDIINGLLNGIGSMGTALKNKVTSMAHSVTDSIKATLGIHSPSRVMAGLGVNIGQGLAQGMDRAQTLVEKASSALAGLTMDPFGTPEVASVMSGSLASQTGAQQAGGGTQYNAPLMHVENQYVNDQNDVREISTGLYGLQRNYDRSNGRS